MPDAAGGLSRLEQALAALQRVAGAPLRVWRSDGRRLKRVAGPPAPDWVPAANGGAGRRVQTPEGPAWLEPIEALAEASLALATCDPAIENGLVVKSLSYLRERGRTIQSLDGRGPLASDT